MSIESQLKQLDIKKLKMDNGKTIEQNLLIEAGRLKDILQKHLDMALLSSPARYAFNSKKRTGMLENSLHIDTTIRYTGSRFEVDVYFDNDANRASGYGVWNKSPHSGEDEVNLPLLLNDGYTVEKDVWFKDLPNFGYREGTKFIENAINEFNKVNQLGIYIDFETDVNLV